jgi:hypothetical protein
MSHRLRKHLTPYAALFMLIACTAETQIGEFLGRQPDPNLVFSDDFESGLGKWNQVAGTWTTGTPAVAGAALLTPASSTPAIFNLTTVKDINLSTRFNCELKYDASHSLSGAAGVYAQILFAGNIVGEFKNTTGNGAISSSTQFVTRSAILPAGITGKLTILTAVATGTTADLKIDNLSVTCAKSNSGLLNVAMETFESGSGNWTLGGTWAVTSGVGQSGSAAARVACINNCSATASYQPSIQLQGRSGCALSYFYDLNGSQISAQDCLGIYWNGIHYRAHCANSTLSAVVWQYLTAFEGLSSNQLSFSCTSSTGNNATCAVDNVTITCQQ